MGAPLSLLWGLVGIAAWVLPDSTFHATTPWTRLGAVISIVFLLNKNDEAQEPIRVNTEEFDDALEELFEIGRPIG